MKSTCYSRQWTNIFEKIFNPIPWVHGLGKFCDEIERRTSSVMRAFTLVTEVLEAVKVGVGKLLHLESHAAKRYLERPSGDFQVIGLPGWMVASWDSASCNQMKLKANISSLIAPQPLMPNRRRMDKADIPNRSD